jgi:hypothetical protein
LQRYIDQCEADGSSNQTVSLDNNIFRPFHSSDDVASQTNETTIPALPHPQRIIERMGVSRNSFEKFMDPEIYKKDQWTATRNGTYWAAAKLLAQVAREKEIAKILSDYEKKLTTIFLRHEKKVANIMGKRKTPDGAAEMATTKKKAEVTGEESPPRKKTSAELKRDADDLIWRVCAVDVRIYAVYDTCPQVVAGIKSFLRRDGMTKASLLSALGGINANSLNTFLSGKKQDQCGNVAYWTAYVFLEKLRILEGERKSSTRLRNEVDYPYGVRGVGILYIFLYLLVNSSHDSTVFSREGKAAQDPWSKISSLRVILVAYDTHPISLVGRIVKVSAGNHNVLRIAMAA